MHNYLHIIILILDLSVCPSREVSGSHLTKVKLFFFSVKLYIAGRYIKESTSTASKGASCNLKEAIMQSVEQK